MVESRELKDYEGIRFTGRNHRLLKEWETMEKRFKNDPEISYLIRKKNAEGLPVTYEVVFNVRSICGVKSPDEKGLRMPCFADVFRMRVNIPNNYPSVDSKLEFKFLKEDVRGQEIPHPWHPNIRYYGDFAGRVCLNTQACGTYTDIAWYVDRVMSYQPFHWARLCQNLF